MEAHHDRIPTDSAGLHPAPAAARLCLDRPWTLRLKSLKLFCDVAETGSFNAAARKNGVKRAVASSEVTGLERHFGSRLFERRQKRNRLTHAGRVVFDYSRRMLRACDALKARFGV